MAVSTLDIGAEFQGIKAFNKEYQTIRKAILARHGIKPGQKVKLVNAVMLYINFGNGFIKYTSTLADMKDRVKMHEITGSTATFQLKAMV